MKNDQILTYLFLLLHKSSMYKNPDEYLEQAF